MDILIITKVIFLNIVKKNEKLTTLTQKIGFLQNFKSYYFVMVNGVLNANITPLDERIGPVAWKKQTKKQQVIGEHGKCQ